MCGLSHTRIKRQKMQNVLDQGDIIVITIPDPKTKKPRTSCVTEPS
jgi:hypothetical protein